MRKKEPSNNGAPSSRRFSLPKSRILRGRIHFQSLFANSKQISTPLITFRYQLSESLAPDIKMAFIAPKRIGNAVKRNKTKRLLREAFRLKQHIVLETDHLSGLQLHGVFIARTAKLQFGDVEKDLVTLLTKLRTRVADFKPNSN